MTNKCIGKVLLIVLICWVLLIANGCTTTTTTSTPIFYSNNNNTEFEILGPVSYSGYARSGFIDLLDAAKRRYPSADYVIDVMVDQRIEVTTKIYPWYVWIWSLVFANGERISTTTSYVYEMRGTAIKYIRNE